MTKIRYIPGILWQLCYSIGAPQPQGLQNSQHNSLSYVINSLFLQQLIFYREKFLSVFLKFFVYLHFSFELRITPKVEIYDQFFSAGIFHRCQL